MMVTIVKYRLPILVLLNRHILNATADLLLLVFVVDLGRLHADADADAAIVRLSVHGRFLFGAAAETAVVVEGVELALFQFEALTVAAFGAGRLEVLAAEVLLAALYGVLVLKVGAVLDCIQIFKSVDGLIRFVQILVLGLVPPQPVLTLPN